MAIDSIGASPIGLASDFEKLFSGRGTAYGEFIPDAKQAKVGKIKGKCRTVVAPITSDLYLTHLKGTKGLGVIPIKENNTCLFAVLDVDIYTTDVHTRVVTTLYEMRMPLVPFRSKSGGLHLYLFLKDPITAVSVIDYMTKFRELLLLADDTEIFPKQKKTSPTEQGNWINLPYLGAITTPSRACMIDSEHHDVADVAQAVNYCLHNTVSKHELETYFADLPLQDAPPCLQHVYLSGDTHHRSDYLFSLGRYYKAKYGDEFDNYVVEANAKLQNPLPLRELMSTVIISNKKKDYSYSCSKEPMSLFCNRKECAKRKFGIGGKEVSNLSFGEFRQILTDPVTYEWIVNEKILQFDSAGALMDQTAFCRQCIDKLLLFPNTLNKAAWVDIVNRALDNTVKVSVDPDDDISPGAMIITYVMEYLVKRAAPSRVGIIRGLVYKDTTPDFNKYVFDIKSLVDYLVTQHQVKTQAMLDLKSKIVKLGGSAARYYVNEKNKDYYVWTIPAESVAVYTKDIPAASIEEFTASLNKDFGVD